MPDNATAIEKWRGEDTINDRSRLAHLLNAILPEGLAGKKVVFGDAAFTTSGTTVEVPAYTAEGLDLTSIDAILVFPKVTHANSDLPFADGVITVNSGEGNNTTTVSRAAGTTSGLSFWFIIVGE